MYSFFDFLKIDEQVVFEKLEFQLKRAVAQARMLGFVSFEQEFLLEPFLSFVRKNTDMELFEPNPEEISTLFSNPNQWDANKMYLLNFYFVELAQAKTIFQNKDWIHTLLNREKDLNTVWLMNHKQINHFAQKYHKEMKNNCFIRILYESSLVFTSTNEKKRSEVLNENYQSEQRTLSTENDPFKIHLNEANQAFQQKQYSVAEKLYQKLIFNAEENGRMDYKAKAIGNLGLVYKMTYRHEEALKALEEQFTLDSKLGNKLNLIACYSNQSSIYSELGEYQTALKLLNLKEKMEDGLENLEHRSETLNNRATIFIHLQDFKTAIQILLEQEKICLKIDSPKNLAICYSNLALAYEKIGNYDRSLRTLHQEEKVLLENQLNDDLPINWHRQVNIYLLFGKYAFAYKLLKFQAEFHQKREEQEQYADTLGNLAVVLYETGQLEEALEYIQREESIKNQLGLNKENFADCYSKKAMIYCAMEKLDKAEAELEKKIALDNPNDYQARSINLHLNAEIKIKLGDYQQALNLLQQELDIHNNTNNELGIAGSYNRMAEAYYNLRDLEKAKDLAHLQLNIEERNQRVSGLIQAYRLLAKIAKSQRNLEEAFVFNTQASKLETYRNKSNQQLAETPVS